MRSLRRRASSDVGRPGDMDTPLHALAVPDADRSRLKRRTPRRRRSSTSSPHDGATRDDVGGDSMIPAAIAVQRPPDAKLMVVDASGQWCIANARIFPSLVRQRRPIIANDAATIPASLFGIHGRPMSRSSCAWLGRRSLLLRMSTRFTAVAFGAGDFRIPTDNEARFRQPSGPRRRVATRPTPGGRGTMLHHPRLDRGGLPGLVEDNRGGAGAPRPSDPVRVLRDRWRRGIRGRKIASRPVAFEAPSAGFVLIGGDW